MASHLSTRKSEDQIEQPWTVHKRVGGGREERQEERDSSLLTSYLQVSGESLIHPR